MEAPATWKTMPKKDQLAVLAAARITELVSDRSHATYVFFQMRSFLPAGDITDSQIVSQVGLANASWAAAQAVMAIFWGRVADASMLGRKGVLLIGLAGTASTTLATGFSTSFFQLVVWKVVAGAMNTNMGIMRSMIGEMTEPRFESRAFLVLPMCLNISDVLGPLLGGFLSDPSVSATTIGEGKSNIFTKFPYAMPNLICAAIVGISAMMVFLGLDETHELLRGKQGIGRRLTKSIYSMLSPGKANKERYQRVPEAEDAEHCPQQVHESDNHAASLTSTDDLISPITEKVLPPPSEKPKSRIRLTRKALRALSQHFFLYLHLSAFNTIVYSFLSAPRATSELSEGSYRLQFKGGLGFSTSEVGIAIAFLGFMGLISQMFIYPRITARMDTIESYRAFSLFSSLAYSIMPLTVLLPDERWMTYSALAVVLSLHALARTFAQPGSVILINKCDPDPEMRSTIHGFGLSVGSIGRTLGPLGGAWALGHGLNNGMVGGVWWGMSAVVVFHWIILGFV